MLKKLYVMEVEGNVTYYNNEYNRAYAFNMLILEKPWLDDKIKMYEVDVKDITIRLDDDTTISAGQVK